MVATDLRPSEERADGRSADKRRAATRLLAIKSSGYLVSTLSVGLLGVVSWKNASQDPLLAACLIGGMATSVSGMFLRWLSYDIEERRKAAGRD
jgi:hypothetical protein